jgi:RNA polymerase sigma factor (sigma-70 family)
MNAAMRHLRRAVLLQDGAGRTDGQLLASFIEKQDGAAFEALVRRHGPMVFGVCRRVVRHHHDAEDAFQATFLVLARKAPSVRPRERVASWLHGVALRTAMRAKALAAKRRGREKPIAQMPEPAAAAHDPWPDLRPLLDHELNGLPENYRLPILLCDLQDKTIKEAAGQLGWPQGTLAGRLARARKLLAKRLARRGLVPSAGSLAGVAAPNAASAGVPASLVSSAVKAASVVSAGQKAIAGVVPVRVAALMEGVMKAMLITKVKTVTAVLLVVAAVGTGGGWLSRPTTVAAQAAQAPGATTTLDAETSQPEYKSCFIKTLAVTAEHFEQITYANQYDGRIEATTCRPDSTGMLRQAYVSLSCEAGKCLLAVQIHKVRTTGGRSEVVGRDAKLERLILTKLSAPQETQGKRFRGAGAEVSVNSDAGLAGSVVPNERNFSTASDCGTAALSGRTQAARQGSDLVVGDKQQTVQPKKAGIGSAPTPLAPPQAAGRREYVIMTRLLEAGAGQQKALRLPKVTVDEGQLAPIRIIDVPPELLAKVLLDEKIKLGLILDVRVKRWGGNKVRLILSLQKNEVEESNASGVSVLGNSVQAVQDVELHKPVKMVFERAAGGSARRWVELTVDELTVNEPAILRPAVSVPHQEGGKK